MSQTNAQESTHAPTNAVDNAPANSVDNSPASAGGQSDAGLTITSGTYTEVSLSVQKVPVGSTPFKADFEVKGSTRTQTGTETVGGDPQAAPSDPSQLENEAEVTLTAKIYADFWFFKAGLELSGSVKFTWRQTETLEEAIDDMFRAVAIAHAGGAMERLQELQVEILDSYNLAHDSLVAGCRALDSNIMHAADTYASDSKNASSWQGTAMNYIDTAQLEYLDRQVGGFGWMVQDIEAKMIEAGATPDLSQIQALRGHFTTALDTYRAAVAELGWTDDLAVRQQRAAQAKAIAAPVMPTFEPAAEAIRTAANTELQGIGDVNALNNLDTGFEGSFKISAFGGINIGTAVTAAGSVELFEIAYKDELDSLDATQTITGPGAGAHLEVKFSSGNIEVTGAYDYSAGETGQDGQHKLSLEFQHETSTAPDSPDKITTLRNLFSQLGSVGGASPQALLDALKTRGSSLIQQQIAQSQATPSTPAHSKSTVKVSGEWTLARLEPAERHGGKVAIQVGSSLGTGETAMGEATAGAGTYVEFTF